MYEQVYTSFRVLTDIIATAQYSYIEIFTSKIGFPYKQIQLLSGLLHFFSIRFFETLVLATLSRPL